MARKDQLTGRGPMSGNYVSKAHNKVKRRFDINLQKKRYYLPDQGKWVTLRVTTRTMRTIDRNGVEAVLEEARRQGIRV